MVDPTQPKALVPKPLLAVRQLVASDLPALLALYTHLHAQDEPPPAAEVVARTWQTLLADPQQLYLGGFVHDELVTSCVLVTVLNLTRGCRPYGLIENVVTHASHRQRGYARAVLHGALQHAWGNGCYKVMLMTGRLDEPTLRFYESTGFDRHAKQAFVARPPSTSN